MQNITTDKKPIMARVANKDFMLFSSIDELKSNKEFDSIIWLKISGLDFTTQLDYPKHLQQIYIINCNYIYDYMSTLPNSIVHVEIKDCRLHSIDKLFNNEQAQLEFINLSQNRLEKMNINFPPNVISIDLSYNDLKILPQTNCFPTSIQLLNLSFNKLKDLPEWFNDIGQQTVVNIMPNHFWFNSYENISLNKTIHDYHLIMAERFFDRGLRIKLERTRAITNNEITNNEIINNRMLFRPQNQLPIRRIIHRANHNLEQIPLVPVRQTTAEQRQNVHNSNIQDSFARSVQILMDNTVPKNNNFYNSMWNYYVFDGLNIVRNLRFLNKVKADCQLTDIVTRVGVTYKEIMERIWSVSENHEHKYAIRSRLKEEVMDGFDVCFTGRITRVVNSLCGLIDGITIGYSVNEQISNAIIAIMRRADNDETINAKNEAKKYLDELKIPELEQQPWLDAL